MVQLVVSGPDGQELGAIAVLKGGQPVVGILDTGAGGRLEIFGSQAQSLAWIGCSIDGENGILNLLGPEGLSVAMGATEGGHGGMVDVFNNQGKVVATMQASKTNCGLVSVHDFDGKPVQALSGTP